MKEEYRIYEEKMRKTLDSLQGDFASVRAGRANAQVLDKIRVEYYGAPTPINQIGGITSPDSRTLVIQPWDKSALKLIENMRKHQVFAQAVKVERKKHPDRIRFAGFETARLRIEHKTVFLRLLFNIDSRFFAYGRTTVKRPRNGRLRYADQFCKFPRSHQAKPLLPFFR